MKEVSHIIWDWNGTVVNDVEIVVSAFNKILVARGYDLITTEQYREYYEHPASLMYQRAGVDLELHDFKKITDDWYQNYEASISEVALFHDIIETFTWFKNSGFEQSVLSALAASPLQAGVAKHNLDNFFSNVYGLTDKYGTSKVELGKTLQSELGLSGSQLVLIGDSRHDYEVASHLNANCILVARGLESRVKLEKCNCPVVSDLTELKAFFVNARD